MANFKVDENIVRRLTDEDRAVLLAIYQHRCLNEPLFYSYFYSKVDVRQSYAAEHIRAMIDFRLIEAVDYGAAFPALFLTTRGVATVKALYRDQLFQMYRFGDKEAVLPQSSDLMLKPLNITHQMALNSFAMEFESYAAGKTFFKYFDEKHMPPASLYMRPDGLIELPGCNLFLEMDMGTERPSILAKKWDSYRSFLNSPGFTYEEKPVVMLFILSGIKNISLRKKNVASSLLKYLTPRINGQFEVIIDSPENLHSIIKTHFLGIDTEMSEKTDSVYADLRVGQGFSASRPPFLSQLDFPCGVYARKLNEQKKVLVINGRPQEFLVDTWFDGRLSVLRNLLHANQFASQVKALTGRVIPYLVVVPSDRWAYTILQIMDAPQPQTVYFTTPDRLNACNWNEALFHIDQLGNLAHFQDDSLTTTVHERRLPKYPR